jgi:flagellar capping protein FliD
MYIPGVKSRFNTEKIIDDLMKIERIPKERAEQNIETLQTRKTWWQDLGRRVTTLRESARMLYSFQNPFNERTALSSNNYVLTATATREADEREYQFTVQQLAQADRFLSSPLDEKTKIDAGSYTFSVGTEDISVNFRGGTLREFADAVTRQGRGKIAASLLTVQPGTRSMILESKVTGAENRLGFSGMAGELAVRLGIAEAEMAIAHNNEESDAFTESTVAESIVASEESEEDILIAEQSPGSVKPASAGAAAGPSVTFRPLNAVSTAQDAIIAMEGITVTRPSNTFNDLIPGVTIIAKGVSERPERVEIQADREGIKNSIITMVGNYNRLMAELNILTRTDDRLVDELAYLDRDETDEMRKRLGAFAGDTTLTQFRANLLRAVSAPYPTDAEQDLALLAQIGISTNTGTSGGAGYNPSRLRGYLEIDEKALDSAIEQHLPAIRQLFASNTSGDGIVDTGVAVNVDALAKPLVELGGIISLKTGTIDSKITQDRRRIDTMERQLAAKEADLKMQYSRMESAYDRMERMSSSLDNFSQRSNNNR